MSESDYGERCMRAYAERSWWIAFTGPLDAPNADPKAALHWQRKPEHLANADFAAGLASRLANRNVAILTGRSGLVAVDLDGKEAVGHFTGIVGVVPDTVVVATPRDGFHLYYRPPEGYDVAKIEVDSAGKVTAWVDGYVIAPPSVRPDLAANGHTPAWRFVDGQAPWDCEIATLPASALDALLAAAEHTRRGKRAADIAGEPILEGDRSDRLVSFGGSMRRRGMSEVAIRAALLEENRARCRPPLDEDEVARIAESVARYRPADSPDAPFDSAPAPDAPPDGGERVADDVRDVDPYINWAPFWARDRTEPDFLVEDILARGRAHSLFAPHKAKKSLLLQYVTAKLATERDDVVVIYLDYEMAEDDLYERLDDMGYGPASNLSRLRYALLPTMPPLDQPEGGKELARLVDAERAAHPGCHVVVVIDTIGRATVGEENSNDTIQNFYRHTGLLLKQRGCTWIRLDHAGKDTARGQRGASAKGDDVDVVWKLTETQTGVKLTRVVARMSWVPTETPFDLVQDPLRFVRVADAWPDGTIPTADALDAAGVPLDAGRPTAGKALRATGVKVKNDVLGAALRFRRVARERTDGPDRDRSSTAGGSAGDRVVQPVHGDRSEDRISHTPRDDALLNVGTGRGDSGDRLPRTTGDNSPSPVGDGVGPGLPRTAVSRDVESTEFWTGVDHAGDELLEAVHVDREAPDDSDVDHWTRMAEQGDDAGV